jgi:hypothetical protein
MREGKWEELSGSDGIPSALINLVHARRGTIPGSENDVVRKKAIENACQ